MSAYKTGIVSIANGSSIVYGSGTAFLSAGIASGNSIKVATHPAVMTVLSVQSQGQLTLTAPWQAADVIGENYEICRNFTPINKLPEIAKGHMDWPAFMNEGLRIIDQRLGSIGDDETLSGSEKVITFSDAQGNVYKFKVYLQA